MGGDGSVRWRTDKNGADITLPDNFHYGKLLPDKWYTLHVEVHDTGSQLEYWGKIVHKDDPTNTAVPWPYSNPVIDSLGSRYTTCNGFGIQLGLAGIAEIDTNYVEVDNFIVQEIPTVYPCDDYINDFSVDPEDWDSLTDLGNGLIRWH